HSADDPQLVVQPGFRRRTRLLVRLAIAILQALLTKLGQEIIWFLALGWREDGKMARLEIEIDRTAVGYFLAALNSLLMTGESLIHHVGGADKKLLAVVPQTVLLGAQLAGVDAQQHVVGIRVFLRQIMGVAGGDERQTQLASNVDGRLGAAALNVQAV